MSVDSQKKSRKVKRTAFTKHKNELEKLLLERNPRTVEITSLYLLVQQIHDELVVLNETIFSNLLEMNASEEDLTSEAQACDEYQLAFNRIKVECDKLKTDTESSERASSTSSARSKRKFKLPQIELTKFGGDPKDWLPFWGQFEKIHLDDDIDNADKVQYLIQATVPGSKARNLVTSYPAVGANYIKMVNGLKSRYGKDELQIEIHVRELLKIILGNVGAKEKISITTLYDSIESHLRALETMGVATEKCAAMLYPLIESCLPEGLLRSWHRSVQFTTHQANLEVNAQADTLQARLDSLMQFLRNEVDNEQRIKMAQEGLGLNPIVKVKQCSDNQQKIQQQSAPTASVLSNNTLSCIFCLGSHEANACLTAKNRTMEEKRKLLADQGVCFRCLKKGHMAKKCKIKVQCFFCEKNHVAAMCPEMSKGSLESQRPVPIAHVALIERPSPFVFLQTLRVQASNGSKIKNVRVLIDPGSQRSFIVAKTARELGLLAKEVETFDHALFGDTVTGPERHLCYKVKMSAGNYEEVFELLSKKTGISSHVSPACSGPWFEEMANLGHPISDQEGAGPIDILLGADEAGKVYTGVKLDLPCGLYAFETRFGWALMGKVRSTQRESMRVSNVFVMNDASISQLWELDVLGIEDPVEKASKDVEAKAAADLFLKTVTRNDEGRYRVRLPWLEDHPTLPTNRHLAEKRLSTTLKRLEKAKLVHAYDGVFQEWLSDGVIEVVEDPTENGMVHYLPHHPVIKAESTTKIRPVFDGSAHVAGQPSLNNCLEKGPNMIELIPNILMRFRMFRIGVTADIRRAFLQIEIDEGDRDVLRFIWLNQDGSQKIFRHRRVVFGINCSPFLLGATLTYHLQKYREENPAVNDTIIEDLAKSLYVDNCVTSFTEMSQVNKFATESQSVLALGKFDLRGWEWSGQTNGVNEIPILGYTWNKTKDSLKISERSEYSVSQEVTKRTILSSCQKIYDPIGFVCPITLIPKLLLQQLWALKIGWDTPVDGDIRRDFKDWWEQLHSLIDIEIPRWEEVMKWSSAERITWQFNPPSAQWWGGFWERLVGVTKGLLRKVLGRACLRYEELLTVICDCESVINNRPITYMSNDPKELTALTPNHFLRCTVGEGTPDCDVSERQAFARRAVYQQRLRDVMSQRFRSEYLGQLRQAQPKIASRSPCVGEIILLGSDNEKRFSWPLGRIIELIIGKDGIARVCKVRTAKGIVSRPVQRLYALECGLETALPSFDFESAASTKEDITTAEKSVIVREPLSERVTRFGRVVRKPPRFL